MNTVKENEISYLIRGAIFDVFNTLGPGLLETTYESALFYELQLKGLNVARQVTLPIDYKGLKLDNGYRIDILVDNLVPIEIKSAQNLSEVHHKQLHTYLKLTGYKLGILVNFNTAQINKSIVRIVNGL